jgi:hypothetical protein
LQGVLPGICAFHHILGTLFQFLFVFKRNAGLFYGLLYIGGEGIKILLHFLIKITCHVISPQELACTETHGAIPQKRKNWDFPDGQTKKEPETVLKKVPMSDWYKQAIGGTHPYPKTGTAYCRFLKNAGETFLFSFFSFRSNQFFP